MAEAHISGTTPGQAGVSGGPAGGSYAGPVTVDDPTSWPRWTTPDYQGWAASRALEDTPATWRQWVALGRPTVPQG